MLSQFILEDRFYPLFPVNNRVDEKESLYLYSRLTHLFHQIISYLIWSEPRSIPIIDIEDKTVYVNRADYITWRTQRIGWNLDPNVHATEKLVQELFDIVKWSLNRKILMKLFDKAKSLANNDDYFKMYIDAGFGLALHQYTFAEMHKINKDEKKRCYQRVAAFFFMKIFNQDQIKEILNREYNPFNLQNKIPQQFIDLTLEGKNLIEANIITIERLIIHSCGLLPVFRQEEVDVFTKCDQLGILFNAY